MIIYALIVGVMVLGAITIIMRRREKKFFNNGHCALCGGEFEWSCMDSQGGTLLECPDCKNGMWFSYTAPVTFKQIKERQVCEDKIARLRKERSLS